MSRPSALQNSAPSWSWTSTISSVAHHVPVRTAKRLVQNRSINRGEQLQDRPDTIFLTGRIARCNQKAYGLGIFDKSLVFNSLRAADDKSESCLIISRKIEDSMPYAQFFSRTRFATGASLLPHNVAVILGYDRQPFGWASFDAGVIPFEDEEDVHIAVFSENEMDRGFDGYNVMFLRSCRGPESVIDGLRREQFVRLGVGEILDLNILTESTR